MLHADIDIAELASVKPRVDARRPAVLWALAGSLVLHASLLTGAGWALQQQASPSTLEPSADKPIQVSLLEAARPAAAVAVPDPAQADPIPSAATEPETALAENREPIESEEAARRLSVTELQPGREAVEPDLDREPLPATIESGAGTRIVSGLPALIRGSTESTASQAQRGHGTVSAPQLPGSDRVIVAGIPLPVQRSPAEQTLAVISFFTGGSGHLDPCLMEERLLAYDDLDSVKALLELRRRCRGRAPLPD